MRRLGDLDLTSLRLFEAAVRLGSLSAAAAEGNIVVSAVSRRVAEMESLLGAPLLYRAVRGVEPTPAGRLLLAHAENLLRLAERVHDDMDRFADEHEGTVRLAANPSVILQFLPDEIAGFLAMRPRVRVDLREAVSGEIVRDIRDGHVDIGLFAANVAHDGLEVYPFREDRLCVVAPVDHWAAERPRLTLPEILHAPHVGLEDGSSLFAEVEERARAAGGTLSVALRVRSFEAVRRMVAAGLGLGVLPRAIAAPHAAADGLAVIPLEEDWARRSFLLGVRERQALPAAAAAFVDRLTDFADPEDI